VVRTKRGLSLAFNGTRESGGFHVEPGLEKLNPGSGPVKRSGLSGKGRTMTEGEGRSPLEALP
jgi:hypothetical protein